MKKSRSSAPSRPSKVPAIPAGNGALAAVPVKGPVPRKRVRDMKSLHSMYLQFLQDDEKSAHNRALVRDAADGAPPFDNDEIEQEGRFNLNFHDLASLLDERNALYTELIDSPAELARFFYPEREFSSIGDVSTKQNVISSEFTYLYRNGGWPDFYLWWDRLTNERSQHGVALAYFVDEFTWKFRSCGLDDFLLPRQCLAYEDAVDVMFIKEPMNVAEFYGYIEDPEAAARTGWNYDEARAALVCASRGERERGQWSRHWAQIQDDLVNNDLGQAYASNQAVNLVHALTREFDGSYSHYIFLESGKGTDFLMQHASRYDKSENAFTISTARAGRNAKFHSIRGDLFRAFPSAQARARLYCGALDSTAQSMALLLQPGESEVMEDMSITMNGPVVWLPPEATVVQRGVTPNLTQNALPMLADMDQTMRQNLGMTRSENIDMANTQMGQMFQQMSLGALTGAEVTRFYRAWKRILTEQFRRIVAIGPSNKRFPEIKEFFERCADRGVTFEDVKKISRVEPYRAAGNGSVAQRKQAYREGMAQVGSLDQVGQALFKKDYYTELYGADFANRYVGEIQSERYVVDARVAALENTSLRFDPTLVPMPGENDLVHAQEHLGFVARELQKVTEYLSQKGEVDPTPMFPILQHLESVLQHVQPHLQAMANDPIREREFKDLQKAFQQITARFRSQVELAQRLMPTQEQQQAELSKLDMKMREHQLKMQIMMEEHTVKMNLKRADVANRVNLRRVQTDSKMSGQVATRNMQAGV